MAEPEKQQIGDGQDNYGQAAGQAAKAAKQFSQQSAMKGAEATANAAAATVQAGVETGKAVSEIAAGGPWGAILSAAWAIIVAEDTIMESISLDIQESATAVDNDALDQSEDEIATLTDAEIIDEDVAEGSSEEGIPAIVINPGDGAALLNADDAEQALAAQFAPDKLGSTVLYENVFDGVDLMYENYSYNIKETILVNEPQVGYEL